MRREDARTGKNNMRLKVRKQEDKQDEMRRTEDARPETKLYAMAGEDEMR